MGLLRVEESWVTPLPPQEAEAALSLKVKPGRLLAFEGDDVRVPFRGEVQGGRLKVVRRAITRNSFVPVVTGTLTAEGDGTRVAVSLEPHPGMAVLVALWALGTLASVTWALVVAGSEALGLLAVMVLPLLGPLVLVLAFRAEVPRTLALLRQAVAPPTLDP